MIQCYIEQSTIQSFAFSFQIYFEDKIFRVYRDPNRRSEINSFLRENIPPRSKEETLEEERDLFHENRFDISAARFLRWYTIHGPITAHISQVPAGFRETPIAVDESAPCSSSSFPFLSSYLYLSKLEILFPISFFSLLFFLFLFSQSPFLTYNYPPLLLSTFFIFPLIARTFAPFFSTYTHSSQVKF